MSTLTNPTTDPLPPQRPLERFVHMETDLFCEGCGYNLHGQPVHRDQRLGLMICRCPECGRFHSAGQGTAATSIWMSRLAAWVLLFWVLLVLGTFTLAVIGFGGLQIVPTEIFATGSYIASDGRAISHARMPDGSFGWAYTDTGQPVNPSPSSISYQRMFRYERYPRPRELLMIRSFLLVLSAGIGFVSGVLLVVFLWHWPKRRYAWVAVLPLLTAAVLAMTFWSDGSYQLIFRWTVGQFVMWGSVQTLFLLIGIRFGRPLARLIVRMFVPPKPRQHLAFLWRADGKSLPSATGQPG